MPVKKTTRTKKTKPPLKVQMIKVRKNLKPKKFLLRKMKLK